MATRGRNFETFYWKCSQSLLYSSNSFYLIFAICLPQQFLQNINNQLIEFNATGTQYRIIFLTKYWFKIIRDWIKGKYRSRQFFLPRIPTNDNATTPLVYMRIIKSRRYSAILVRTRNSSIIEHPGFRNLLKLYIARVALSILYSLQYASPRVQSHVYFINNHGTRIRNIISDFNRGELHINRH